jgi:hypothetical protein
MVFEYFSNGRQLAASELTFVSANFYDLTAAGTNIYTTKSGTNPATMTFTAATNTFYIKEGELSDNKNYMLEIIHDLGTTTTKVYTKILFTTVDAVV